MKVRVVGSLKQPGRCAYCHDELDALGRPCEGCQIWLHVDCWEEVETCPSPGCEEAAPRQEPLVVRSRPARESKARESRASDLTDEGLRAWAAASSRERREYGFRQRNSPSFRLLLSLAFNAAVLLAVLVLVVLLVGAAASDPDRLWNVLSDGEGRSFGALITLAILLGVICFATFVSGSWLLLWPRVWGETQRLLTSAAPDPLRVRVWSEQAGRGQNTYAEFQRLDGSLRPGMGKVWIQGILPPRWLTQPCEGKPVLVYGLEDGEPPYLIEDASGQLALIHP